MIAAAVNAALKKKGISSYLIIFFFIIIDTKIYAAEKKTPSLSWNNPFPIQYGTVLNNIQLNAVCNEPENLVGTFIYEPTFNVRLDAGNGQILKVTCLPDDQDTYDKTVLEVIIDVCKVSPSITWDPPNSIVYGTVLDDIFLCAKCSDPVGIQGEIRYEPLKTFFPVVFGHKLTAIFTPTDLNNFNVVSKSILVDVKKYTPNIIWENQLPLQFGTKLTNLVAKCEKVNYGFLKDFDIKGTFIYNPSEGAVVNSGHNLLSVTFLPDDNNSFETVTKSISINVIKKTPVLTWPTPEPMYGVGLSIERHLKITCVEPLNLPGNFKYFWRKTTNKKVNLETGSSSPFKEKKIIMSEKNPCHSNAEKKSVQVKESSKTDDDKNFVAKKSDQESVVYSGKIFITKIDCSDLIDVETWGGKNDPYVVVQIGDKTFQTVAKEEAGSAACFDDLDFCFDVDSSSLNSSVLNVKAWDKNRFHKDVLIGESNSSLSIFAENSQEKNELLLELTKDGAFSGKVILHMKIVKQIEPSVKSQVVMKDNKDDHVKTQIIEIPIVNSEEKLLDTTNSIEANNNFDDWIEISTGHSA